MLRHFAQVLYNGKCSFRCKSKPQSSDSQYKAPTMCQGVLLNRCRKYKYQWHASLPWKFQSASVGSVKKEKPIFCWFPRRARIWSETWRVSNISTGLRTTSNVIILLSFSHPGLQEFTIPLPSFVFIPFLETYFLLILSKQ